MKSKGRLVLAMGVLFLSVTLVSGLVAYFLSDDLMLFAGGLRPSAQVVLPTDPEPEEEAEEIEPEEQPDEEEYIPELLPQPVRFNVPGEMRGVFIAPGVDYLLTANPTASGVRGEIDKALAQAKDLTCNSVFIATAKDGKVIYSGSTAMVFPELDVMQYIVDKSREMGLYTYGIFDMSIHRGEGRRSEADTIDNVTRELRRFAETYELDGILLDGYQNMQSEESYGLYKTMGGGIGFESFMRQSPTAMVRTASNTIRRYAPGTQVGLLADAVWQNESDDELGSKTKAAFTSLGSGNADTRGFIERQMVDFVAVKAFASLTNQTEPFKEVVGWWSEVAGENGIPLYVVHASEKIATQEEGWLPHDQITRQVIEASGFVGYRGSIFNNLSRLAENPRDATATLVKYYNNEVEAAHILTELAVTRPERTSYTTFEPIVNFVGASDPNSPVTINGEEISTDRNGYFTVTMELEAGENSFVIEHKEKTIRYSITRQVQILREIAPHGNIAVEGGMSISISALAYADAQVYATINGQRVPMEIDESMETEEDRDSAYKLFYGEFTAPAATSSEQNLGNIVVHGSWQGQTDSIQGALVKVNKRVQVSDGVPVIVTAAQARTYPPNTLNNIPNAMFYPLPAGAMDYAVGSEIVFRTGNNAYTYFVLASGLRVQSKDLSATSEFPVGNVVSEAVVSSDDNYTYLTLKTAQKVSYAFTYTNNSISIRLNYTDRVPSQVNIGRNPLFTNASWRDSTLTLNFAKTGGFMGYRGYFDQNGNLVFRFTNPPPSVAGARIVIDPGHGGAEPGARGFLPDYPERVLNLAIAQRLADDLRSRGASVLLLDTSRGMALEERVRRAEEFNADVFVSVHNNSATNSNATGSEMFYFTPYSQVLAATASRNVSASLGTHNRGAKYSYYHVTLSPQFVSILAECGFMSNRGEYEKLLRSSTQTSIAKGLADAISAAIRHAYPGSGRDGSGGGNSIFNNNNNNDNHNDQSGFPNFTNDPPASIDSQSPNDPPQSDDPPPSNDSDSIFSGLSNHLFSNEDGAVTDITLSEYGLHLQEGERFDLKATVYPSRAGQAVEWKSSDERVATVDQSGRVTAIRHGTAIITAKSCSDPEFSAECRIDVG